VGVIGCGGIAQMMHLPFLAERPDLFEIGALCDIDPRILEAMGRRYRVDRLHADRRRLLDEEVDAVLVLSGGSHAATVIDAARAGKHIFVEKPLGENIDEVEATAEEVERAGTLVVGYHKRYDPGYRFAREQVLGLRDLRMVRVDVLHPVDARARDHHWLDPPADASRSALAEEESTDGLEAYVLEGPPRRAIEAIVGAGAPSAQKVATFLLFNSLIHDINAVRGILGEPEEVLLAEVWRGGRCMHVVLRFGEGVRCALSWIYLPGLHHYKEELLFLSPESRVCLTFPSPYYRHFPSPVTVEVMEEDRLVRREVTVSMEEAFRAELHHFHACVTRGQPPHTGIADARADTLLLEKIARACRT